jgi:hypothetical protein
MATWQKLIFSGSNAQVASLDILSSPSTPISLEVEGNIEFPNMPVQPPSGVGDLLEGTLVKSSTEVDGGWNLMVKNPPTDTPPQFVTIPFNNAGFDTNGDGSIGSADLLEFLIAYGDTVENLGSSEFDYNNDGEIGSADLLGFLIAYGEDTVNLGDTRPSLNWNSSEYGWIVDGQNYATSASVNTYHETFPNPADFWTTGGLPAVKLYIEKTATATIELFIYIYFTQGQPGYQTLSDGTPIYGGNSYYTTPNHQITGTYPL